MKNKKLEFEIIDDKILTVADFDWFIDCIDAIYVRYNEVYPKGYYSIFIQQGSEIVQLYFKTDDELLIAREYKRLVEAIKAVRPLFDNSAEKFVLINYANLKQAEMKFKYLQPIIDLEFTNSNLTINGGTKKYNIILDKLNEANAVNEV